MNETQPQDTPQVIQTELPGVPEEIRQKTREAAAKAKAARAAERATHPRERAKASPKGNGKVKASSKEKAKAPPKEKTKKPKPEGKPALSFNPKEAKVLACLQKADAAMKLVEIGKHCFSANMEELKQAVKDSNYDGADNQFIQNSWARNSIRKLVKLGLVRTAGRGAYKITAKGLEFKGA